MATNLPDLIHSFADATAKIDEAQAAVARYQLPAVEKARDALEAEMLRQMTPNQPYVLDEGRRLVKVRHHLFGWQLLVVPANAVPVVAPQGAAASWGKLIAVALVTWALSSGAPAKAWDWLRLHLPSPDAPDVAPKDLTAAGKAGYSWSRDFLLKQAGDSLVKAGSDIKSHARKIPDARAENQKRLAELFKVPADTPAEKRPEYPLVKLLDAIVPPGSDPAKITPQQEEQVGQLLIEYGLGIQGKAK